MLANELPDVLELDRVLVVRPFRDGTREKDTSEFAGLSTIFIQYRREFVEVRDGRKVERVAVLDGVTGEKVSGMDGTTERALGPESATICKKER